MYLGPGALLGSGCLLGAYSPTGVGVTHPTAAVHGGVMQIKRGDSLPDLVADLAGDTGPVDLTGATIKVLGTRAGALVINQEVSGSAQGVVTMPWPSGSTDVPGLIGFEFEVTWPGGRRQTFPDVGLVWVEVTPDLG